MLARQCQPGTCNLLPHSLSASSTAPKLLLVEALLCTHTQKPTVTHARTDMQKYVCTLTRAYMCACAVTSMCTSMHVHICTLVCVLTHMHTYTQSCMRVPPHTCTLMQTHTLFLSLATGTEKTPPPDSTCVR